MTRFKRSWGLALAMVAVCLATARADERRIFNTVSVDGKAYVNIADFVRYYGFDTTWKQNGLDVTLRSKYKRFQLRINSRECFVNRVRIWLNDSPLENRNSILISEIDVQKTLDPVLRAWSVPRRKVRTVMIDPGHGGEDKGAQGRRSIEKILTLDLAARVEKLLRQAGFRTLMTRRDDSYVSPEERPEMLNSSEADVFLSLHCNSAKPNAEPNGVETYCLTPSGQSSTGTLRRRWRLTHFDEEAGNQFDEHNALLAYLVQYKILAGVTGVEDRGIKRARFVVLKDAERPAILVESGFLSHPSEEKRLLDARYRDKLAVAIVEGIRAYATLMNRVPKKS
jgi:N-acetylmuramoyl-L-alanine amidase